jgi:hypothetical protein
MWKSVWNRPFNDGDLHIQDIYINMDRGNHWNYQWKRLPFGLWTVSWLDMIAELKIVSFFFFYYDIYTY